MATCKQCGDEVDALVSVKVDGKAKKMCEDCADRAREQGEIAEASESVVQGMMGFKGRR
jgi:ribosome-binding protein aMBF1 (putative translation factor)